MLGDILMTPWGSATCESYVLRTCVTCIKTSPVIKLIDFYNIPILLQVSICLFVCLFGNYSLIIGHKGLKFSGFNESHCGYKEV